METEKVRKHFNALASSRIKWKRKAKYYHDTLEKLYAFLIPKNSRVLEIGSGTAELLQSVGPAYGMGIDLAEEMIVVASKKYPHHHFVQMDAQNLSLQEKFDYVIMSDLIGNLEDVQKAFEEVHKVTDNHSRFIVSYYNTLWEPVITFAEKIGLKMRQPTQNWLSQGDIQNLLELANFESIKKGTILLIPISIPFISNFVNRFIAKLPFLKHLCLVQYIVARKKPSLSKDADYSVSLIIPARNEEGNIEKLVNPLNHNLESLEAVYCDLPTFLDSCLTITLAPLFVTLKINPEIYG